ncbi:hypothetical protein P8452_44564 [Trifolium repens]|nr:hypothetical protein P8452_44564 [Trifolium repens]
MADIVLCPLLQVVFERLSCHLLKLVAEACGFEEEIEKFQRSIRHIKPLLEDAEQQQANNKALKSWLIQLRAVAYDADDLLDEFSLSLNHISDGLQSSSSGRFFKYKFVENVVSSFRSYASYLELFPKLKRIRQNLDDLVCDMSSFHLKQLSVEFDAGNESAILESSSLPRYISKIRHTSVVSDFGAHVIPENLYEAKKLRSLHLLFPKDHLGEGPANWFSEFRYLRLLNLSGSGIKRLHESISSLISLRVE